MSKAGSPVPSGRTRMTPSPGVSDQKYFIVQCFISYSEQPQTPLILRIDTNASVNDVLHQSLNKYSEVLKHSEYDPTTLARYAPPSSSVEDYILRVAKGDGTPDRSAPPLDKTGLMSQQGLLFPYMLVLTLDPDKDINSMQLTDEYKATLMRRTSQEKQQSAERQTQMLMNSIGASRGHRSPSLTSEDVPPPPPQQQERQARELAKSQVNKEQELRKTVEENLLKKDEIERLRLENIRRKELERAESERRKIEACEKRELERRKKMAKEKEEEEQRQLLLMEENHKLEMARKMDQYMREQKHREMMAAQKEELDREEKERKKRAEALERERQLRIKQKDEEETQVKQERHLLREMGREKRMSEMLDTIVSKLENDIDSDNMTRVQMLERERIEREAYEQEVFEREYIAKVERNRKQQKEKDIIKQIELERKREEHKRLIEQSMREEEARIKNEEEERKIMWKAKFRAEKEKRVRQKDLALIQKEETEEGAAAAVTHY